MTDNPTIAPTLGDAIEPGTFEARSWHELDLLQHAFSDDAETAMRAQVEIDRRRLVRETLSSSFRLRQIARQIKLHRDAMLTRSRKRRRLWWVAGFSVTAVALTLWSMLLV